MIFQDEELPDSCSAFYRTSNLIFALNIIVSVYESWTLVLLMGFTEGQRDLGNMGISIFSPLSLSLPILALRSTFIYFYCRCRLPVLSKEFLHLLPFLEALLHPNSITWTNSTPYAMTLPRFIFLSFYFLNLLLYYATSVIFF